MTVISSDFCINPSVPSFSFSPAPGSSYLCGSSCSFGGLCNQNVAGSINPDSFPLTDAERLTLVVGAGTSIAGNFSVSGVLVINGTLQVLTGSTLSMSQSAQITVSGSIVIQVRLFFSFCLI